MCAANQSQQVTRIEYAFLQCGNVKLKEGEKKD